MDSAPHMAKTSRRRRRRLFWQGSPSALPLTLSRRRRFANPVVCTIAAAPRRAQASMHVLLLLLNRTLLSLQKILQNTRKMGVCVANLPIVIAILPFIPASW
jgi:hypothetical protein